MADSGFRNRPSFKSNSEIDMGSTLKCKQYEVLNQCQKLEHLKLVFHNIFTQGYWGK